MLLNSEVEVKQQLDLLRLHAPGWTRVGALLEPEGKQRVGGRLKQRASTREGSGESDRQQGERWGARLQ